MSAKIRPTRPKSDTSFEGRRTSNPESCFFRQLKEASIHPKIIKQARKTGQLNLSNRGIAEMPDIVWSINSLTSDEVKTLSISMDQPDEDQWWEYVELTKMILASNSLKTVSPDIRNYQALNVLDLHDNSLTSLPESLGELQALTKLNISRNQFEELPPCVFELKLLRILFAQHNKLTKLSDDISNLSSLEELDISNNKLKKLPHYVGFLSHVNIFNASHNELVCLPSEIGDLSALRRLELSNNKIEKLPEQIGNLHHLEQLYVQHNKIVGIPCLPNCSQLKEIHCGFNCINEISSEFIESLVGIKILDFRDNKISELPDNISWVQSLERLDLTNNNLSSLPYSLGTLPHLKFLAIEGNPLRSVRRDIIQRGTVQLLRWLRSRIDEESLVRASSRTSNTEVDYSKGEPIPQGIDKYSLRATKTLTYSNKKVAAIPQELVEMASEAEVNIVDFSKNIVSNIPDSMKTLLSQCTEINLGFNRLTALPSFMGECSRLAYLDLRNNQLQDLPAEISNLSLLREINVSFNKFQYLPSAMYSLQRLEIIIASDNAISDIDVSGLSKLQALAVLDLHNNNIKNVPPELGTLTQLRSLLLEGNLFRNPRPAILTKGTSAVLEFLRGRMSNA